MRWGCRELLYLEFKVTNPFVYTLRFVIPTEERKIAGITEMIVQSQFQLWVSLSLRNLAFPAVLSEQTVENERPSQDFKNA